MIEVSEQLMRAAFERKLKRATETAASRGEVCNWPGSFALAMVSPIYSRLVYIEALHGEAARVHFKPDSRAVLPSKARQDGTRYWWQDRD